MNREIKALMLDRASKVESALLDAIVQRLLMSGRILPKEELLRVSYGSGFISYHFPETKTTKGTNARKL